MECHKVSIPFSKKLSSSHSFSGASIYDGVFGGGPMNVRSRVEEDYGKIFGGSSSSSIPVLDVPELNERKICVDVKSSKLDYSKIFGGFGECDFAVSYEELSAESKKRHSFVEEARTAAETGSHPSNVSAENQDSLEAEASCQSVDGRKQFKMSYHRAKQERKNGTNGTTHVTQLNAVPGYTCLIDEFAPSRITEDVGKPLLSAVNGTRLNTNFSGEILQGKHRRKTLSVHSPGGSSKQASRDGVNFQNEYNHSRSYPNDVLFDACEIGFRTRVPKVPVPSSQSDGLINNKGDSKTSVGSKTEVSNGHSSEDATGFCSPTYFDEEVDVNSVAATSAAAVKKAIEEAQARIRIAKEIMERKKDGLQNHVKPRFKKHPKAEECREDKITNEFREEARQKCEKVDAPIQDFASLGTENAMKAEQAALDFRERDSLFSAKEASGETQGDKNKGTLMKDRQEEMKDLKEEKWGGIGAKLVRSVNDIFKERIFTMKMFEKPEEDGKKLKTFGEGQEHEDVERKMNAVQGACELKEGSCKAKSGEWVEDQEEYGQKSTVSGVQEEHEMTFKASHNVETREKKQRRLWDLTASKYKVEMQLKDNKHELKGGACEPMSDQGVRDQKEYGKESKFAGLQVEKEVKASHEVGASEKKQRRLWDLTANEFKLEIQLKDNERTKMRKLKDEHAWLASEKKQREVLEQKETDIRSEDLAESEEDEEALKEICENGKTNEATYESVQFEKQQETCGWEENEEGLEDVHGREDSENKSDEAREQENVEVTINEFHDGKQSGKKLQEDFESGAEGRVLEAEENEQMLKEAYGMKEIDKRLEESCEWAETEEIKREIEPREDEKMKVTQEVCNFRNNLEAANDVCEQDKNEILHETLEASVHDEYDEYLEVSTHEENGEGVEVTRALSECKEMETEVNDQEEKGIFEFKIAGLAQVFLEHTGIQKEVEDTTEVQASERNGLNIGVSDTNAWQKQSDQRDKESKAVCNAGNFYEGTCESEEKFEEVEAAIEQGEDESNSEFSHEERWFYNGENMEATQLPSMFQGKGESTEIADDIKTSQNIEHKENHSETLKTEGREVEGTMQNEVELQKEHVRKTDGAKEKEREREKERIAVERAIREARERAFTEARERAAVEKANAEARRRAMAGARERLEKTSAEVNDKSSADKTSMEARLKAERTAVERATAEARVRALEKAMSKKATSKARNQAVKSSGASRENGMRNNSAANDSQYRGSGPNRIPHSINESDEANGGSVQRHEARSESHQRVAERAAKALAEKNKRDLLAQKEQAERNRLAEALDIDVRRWSSGKTGNLRALLSTLHYILGPDSGWQPIPLTDLIATAAVKKAYRKATLCVHPDKLQQRGASIQQKYTCEKVFDLLKEAWNKFNAEER